MKLNKECILGVMCLATTACSPHQVQRNPAPPLETPSAFKSSQEGARVERWWVDFKDPQLNRLVDLALRDSFQIKAAWARLDQVLARLTQAKSAAWPEIQASLRGTRSRSRSPFAGVEGTEMFPDTFTIDNFNASLAASYELDVWRKAGSRSKSAMLESFAVRDDLESLAMTLTSQVAETYYQWVTQHAVLVVLKDQSKLSESFLELAKFRFEQGLGSASDIYQQQEQLLSLQSQVPNIEAAMEVLTNQLAILVGRPPHSLILSDADIKLPELPDLPGTGIPADLLERRPDVRSARKRVEAADHLVAAAVADRLPSLTLSGSTGYQENRLPNFFDGFVWSVAGAVLAPIFDRGRRRAEVDRNEALVSEGLAGYGQSLLTAMVEVENALVSEKKQAETIEILDKQIVVGESALREARSRYQSGVADQGYLSVLTALLKVQQNEVARVRARRQLVSYRIQLCRALGGSWTGKLSREVAEEG